MCQITLRRLAASGGASPPAVTAARMRIAEMTGTQAVQIARQRLDIGQILTAKPPIVADPTHGLAVSYRGRATGAVGDIAFTLGVSRGIDPFMTLSSMALPVIPSLRITTRGVFDVTSQRYV